MSFAMDDVSQLFDVQKLQVTLRNKSSSKIADETNVSDSSNVQPSEKFVLSDNFDNKVSNINDVLLKKQEQENMIEQVSKDLGSIKQSFSDIKDQTQKIKENDASNEDIANTNQNIHKSLEDIDKTAKESKFNDKKLLDGSMSSQGLDEVSLKTLGFSNNETVTNKEDAQKLQEKVQKTTEEITKKQIILDKKSKDIIDEVDSTIEFETDAGKESIDIAEPEKAEIVKNDIQKEVFKSPVKSVKIQIKHLDKDIILAMLSLKKG